MRKSDFLNNPIKLLKPGIVQMVGSIHEHKGKQELFLETNIDELKTLLELALIQSTGASNRIEGIFASDKRLEELVKSGRIAKVGAAIYRICLFGPMPF